MNAVIGVLGLQGDVREHVAALTAAGAHTTLVRRAAELEAVDGLVIPGGESTTMSRLADIFDIRATLERRIKEGLPVYGSCAGMIMLADHILDGRDDQRPFGGIDMVVRRNAFGRQVDSFEAELEVAGVDGSPVRAVFIRAPWVERVGPQVEILAQLPGVKAGPDGDRQGATIVAVRQGALLATAFHPELTGDTRLHQLFVKMVRASA